MHQIKSTAGYIYIYMHAWGTTEKGRARGLQGVQRDCCLGLLSLKVQSEGRGYRTVVTLLPKLLWITTVAGVYLEPIMTIILIYSKVSNDGSEYDHTQHTIVFFFKPVRMMIQATSSMECAWMGCAMSVAAGHRERLSTDCCFLHAG